MATAMQMRWISTLTIDNDGLTDEQEAALGTNPFNPEPTVTATQTGRISLPSIRPSERLLEPGWDLDGHPEFSIDPPSPGHVTPVVITGPATLHGADPGVVRLQNVSSSGFEIRYQEWDYLDGIHGNKEAVPYLVLEKGR